MDQFFHSYFFSKRRSGKIVKKKTRTVRSVQKSDAQQVFLLSIILYTSQKKRDFSFSNNVKHFRLKLITKSLVSSNSKVDALLICSTRINGYVDVEYHETYLIPLDWQYTSVAMRENSIPSWTVQNDYKGGTHVSRFWVLIKQKSEVDLRASKFGLKATMLQVHLAGLWMEMREGIFPWEGGCYKGSRWRELDILTGWVGWRWGARRVVGHRRRDGGGRGIGVWYWQLTCEGQKTISTFKK